MVSVSLETYESRETEKSAELRIERIVEILESTCRYLLTKWLALRKIKKP